MVTSHPAVARGQPGLPDLSQSMYQSVSQREISAGSNLGHGPQIQRVRSCQRLLARPLANLRRGGGPPTNKRRLCGPDTGALSLTTLSGCPLSDEPVIGALSC